MGCRGSAAGSLAATTIGGDIMVKKRLSRWLGISLVLLLLILSGVGALYYRVQVDQLREHQSMHLQAILDSKISQINAWRQERLGDAAVTSANAAFAEAASDWMRSQDSHRYGEIRDWFQTLQTAYDYHDVLLLDAEGSIRFSLEGRTSGFPNETLQMVADALRQRRPLMGKIYADSASSLNLIDVAAPLFASRTPNAEAVGAVVLEIDASRFLYRVVQHDPYLNSQQEAVLLGRDGESALVLSPLPNQPDAALSLRLPFSEAQSLPVRAVLGESGVLEGQDQDGVDVWAAVGQIPNSPWTLIVEENTAPLFAELLAHTVQIMVVMAALSGALVIGIWAVWLRNRQENYRLLFEAEQDRRRIEERYRRVVDDQTDPICRYNRNLRLTFVNRAYAELYGKQPEDLLGAGLLERLSEGERWQTTATIASLTAEHPLSTSEHHVETPGRGVRWIEWTTRALVDDRGQVFEYQSMGHDITGRRRAEEARTASEEKYRSLIESSDAAISMVDADGRYLFLNRIAALPYGVSADALIGKTVTALFPPEEARQIMNDVRRVIQEKKGMTLEPQVTIGGRQCWFRTSIQPVHDTSGVPFAAFIYAVEITENKLTELALRASELRYRQMFELHGLPKLIVDAETGALIDANLSASHFYGFPVETLKTLTIFDINLSPKADVREKMSAARDSELLSCEFIHRAADGSPRNVEVFTGPVDVDGKLTLYSVITDITEKRRAEAALQKAHDTLEQRVAERTAELEHAKKRIEAIFNNSGDAILLLDVKQGIQQANPAFATLFAYPPGSFLGIQLADLAHSKDAPALEQIAKDIATTPNVYNLEITARRANGTFFDAEISVAPLSQPDSGDLNLVCIIHDISPIKAGEAALRHSEARLRESERMLHLVLDTIPVLVFWKDRSSRYLGCNKQFARAMGYTSANDILGKQDDDLLALSGLAATYQSDDALVMETGVPKLNFEEPLTSNEGETIILRTSKLPLRDDGGNIIGVLGISLDITASKAAEEAIRQSEERNRIVVTTLSEGIFLLDANGVAQACNPAAEQILGVSAADLIGRSTADIPWIALREDGTLYAPGDLPTEITLASGTPLSDVVVGIDRTNGSPIWVSVNTRPIFEPGDEKPRALVVSFADITERKRSQAILEKVRQEELEMQRHLKSLHDASLQLMQMETLDAFYQRVVELGLEYFGFERMGLLLFNSDDGSVSGTFGTDTDGNVIDERTLHYDSLSFSPLFLTTMHRGQQFDFAEQITLSTLGQPVGTGWNAVAALWNHELLGWLAVDNGVTHKPATRAQLDVLALYALTIGSLLARRKAEDALRESEARYHLIVDVANEGLQLTDPEGRIVYVNPGMNEMLGYSPEEMLGRLYFDFIDLSMQASARQRFEERKAGTRGKRDVMFRRKDGSRVWALVSAAPIFSTEGKFQGVLAMCSNIDDRKRYEESLERALQKEIELGALKSRFVAMTSHEFRTPLAVIMASTETLSQYSDKLTDQQRNIRLERIHQQVLHLAAMIDDVLQLEHIQTGRVEFNREKGDLDTLCRAVIEDYQSQKEYEGRVHYTCSAPAVMTSYDPRLMRQVISNLISNALKYSPADKVVTVTLQCEAGQAVLEVTDQGIGIPPEDLAHLFEPFHRATNVGTISGTGLGLSIVKQAVEMHGGSITPVSQVGVGTTFIVSLPILSYPQAEVSPPAHP